MPIPSYGHLGHCYVAMPTDPEDDMEDMVEGGDEGDPDAATPTPDPAQPSATDSTSETMEVEGGAVAADGNGGVAPNDPWAHIGELPEALREMLVQLKEGK